MRSEPARPMMTIVLPMTIASSRHKRLSKPDSLSSTEAYRMAHSFSWASSSRATRNSGVTDCSNRISYSHSACDKPSKLPALPLSMMLKEMLMRGWVFWFTGTQCCSHAGNSKMLLGTTLYCQLSEFWTLYALRDGAIAHLFLVSINSIGEWSTPSNGG